MFIGLILSVRWWGRLFFPLPYFELVSAHARRHSLDPLLVEALIREESSFDPHAVSKRGALGLMQIMPETGLWIASQLGEELTPARLLAPEENIRYGVWYLATLFERFAGDAVKTLAAYNAGYNRVEEWRARGIWDGTLADLGRLPFLETRSYV
ncbi:MAG: lytic transglycosylase domain-containing protein, partial [Firmicutes bacterium]|nr:lytic transglycosylase domain-containing protein [Bacillota bacterium]